MKVLIKKVHPDAKIPVKGHESDLCYDCYATSMKDLGDGRIEYGLGIAIQVDQDADPRYSKANKLGFNIYPRSSIHKTGLLLSNSVGKIDPDYTGELKAVFYNFLQDLPNYKIGDRICQLSFTIASEITFVMADNLQKTIRGSSGYGSTGNS